MLKGEKVALRARQESDIPVFEAELHADVATYGRASSRPWRPVPPGSPDSPFRVQRDDSSAAFSALEVPTGELAGEAALWGIDTHNRVAHIGLSLRQAFRGKGLGTDIVRVLCRYGFEIRGLHRLQIETLADNAAMINAAKRAGFSEEGRLRRSAWVNGEFADEVIFGLLADEWSTPSGS
jgi:RimJ/RimL family protein N-acetyltransferase